MKNKRVHFLAGLLIFGLLMISMGMNKFAAAIVADQTTTRASVSSAGVEGDDSSNGASISADGRYVAFFSAAKNLVANDTNEFDDVFIHDRETGTTTRVSVNSAGAQADAGSYVPALSTDGRFVVFSSLASNLAAGDTPDFDEDIYVRDRQTGQTTLVSVSSAGVKADFDSFDPDISGDGRYVVFISLGENLVAGDNNMASDIFLHDRQTGQTTLISASSTGVIGNDYSDYPSISADGRFITFMSLASNLVPGDTNDLEDIFVHDRQTGQTSRVSVGPGGVQSNDSSFKSGISNDGRFVVFESMADNLVAGDTNDMMDIFVHDRQTGQTTRVSTGNGAEANGDSYEAVISGNGRYVAFESDANNLVAGDTNDQTDIFIFDRQTGETVRASVSSSNVQGNDFSIGPSISDNGLVVAFNSYSDNLVANDNNGVDDIFVFEFDGSTPPPPTPPPGAPAITSFSPTTGPIGTTVTINGVNLDTATSVAFNGVAAQFTVISDTQLTAVVPVGATTGKISVRTPEGTVSSASNFVVEGDEPEPAAKIYTPVVIR